MGPNESEKARRSAKARRERLRSPVHRQQSAERPARMARALALRVEGRSEREIARALGCSPYTAHHLLVDAMREGTAEIQKRGADFKKLELERLEYPVTFLRRHVRKGDADAAREWRALSESRRKLLGLDARPDADTGTAEVVVTLRFAPAADGSATEDVRRAGADDRRPAALPVDRDGDKDR